MTLTNRIHEVETRLQAACERSGRSPEDVSVIAVTKYVSTQTAIDVLNHGYYHLGENRWQVAQEKWNAISGDGKEGQALLEGSPEPLWHFIGSLQTNKVKEVIGRFTYIHSLDRLSLAQAIHKRAAELGLKIKCFIQVNVSGETSKQGMRPEEVLPFVEQIRELTAIEPIGLMTMAPFEAEPEETRPVFRALRELRDRINEQLSEPLTQLSMGMSNDFEVAIEEGATWVRLGTVLVGKEEA